MRKFTFSDNRIKLDINGETYYIETGNRDMAKEILTMSEKSLEMAAEIQDETNQESIDKAIEFLVNQTDSFLGEGSTKKIFANRVINFLDLIELLHFICEEVKSQTVQKMAKYTPKPNRSKSKKQ